MAELRGEAVVLRPLEPADAEPLRAIRATPEVAAWWGPPEDDFPLADEPDVTRFAILHEGALAGMVQYAEEPEPDYRHASVDVFVDPRRHRRGICTDAIRTLLRHLTGDRGHHRVTIDPAVDNAAAISCYERAGFERVGVMRRAERNRATGEWHDVLLMEHVLPA